MLKIDSMRANQQLGDFLNETQFYCLQNNKVSFKLNTLSLTLLQFFPFQKLEFFEILKICICLVKTVIARTTSLAVKPFL